MKGGRQKDTYHGTGGIRHSSAVIELYIGAIASHHRVDLGTEAAGACETPFTTRCPGTIVGHLTVHGLTHDRIQFKARLEGSEKCLKEFVNLVEQFPSQLT